MKTQLNKVKTTLQPHSKAKVEFLKSYLERYLRILDRVAYIQKINLYDVFCGMGIYEDGGKGSPIVVCEAINEISKQEQSLLLKISLHLNDIEKEKIDNVKKYIEQNKLNNFEIQYYNLDVQQMFNIVLQNANQNIQSNFNLAFIDPYGYKEIKREVLLGLLQNKHTEIILFLPISHMYRFTGIAQKDTSTSQYQPLRDFVNGFFPIDHPIRNDSISDIHQYIDYIKTAFSFNEKRFSASYFIERDKTNFNCLFFITSHIYGFEKILEVKWQLNCENGKGFMQAKPASLFDEQFEADAKENNFEKLKQILVTELSKKQLSNLEIYRLAIRNEFLPKHATDVLKYLQATNKISVIDIDILKKARKNSFYLNYSNHKNNSPKVIIELTK